MQRRVKIGQFFFNYYVKGSGNPIIMIHGWGASARECELNSNFLSKFFTVYYFDLPGHGISQDKFILRGFFEDYVNFISIFITTLNLDNIFLWGQSFGTVIVLKYLLNNKRVKINGIILSSLLLFKPSFMKQIFSKILELLGNNIQILNLVTRVKNNKNFLNYWKNKICLKNNKNYDSIVCDLMYGYNKVDAKIFLDGLISLLNLNTFDILKSVPKNINILFIYGRYDKISKSENSLLDLKKLFNRKNIFVINNASHCPTREQEKVFNHILLSHFHLK